MFEGPFVAGSQLEAPSFFERREVIELRAKLLGEAKNLRISNGMNQKGIAMGFPIHPSIPQTITSKKSSNGIAMGFPIITETY